jgi:carbon-monoxide dehydrogenase large subunit
MIGSLEMAMDESSPCLTNPMGVKGVGELGTIGAAPAVTHAVLDALGVLDADMPLTPQKIWRILRERAR